MPAANCSDGENVNGKKAKHEAKKRWADAENYVFHDHDCRKGRSQTCLW